MQLEHISLEELNQLPISSKTKLSVTIEEAENRRQIALEAMKKLKGSGNGNLINTLYKSREAERRM